MNLSMKDRVAVVTGGSKGIGIAVARRFAESGAKVAILARGAADLKTAREALVKDGLAVRDYACDVSKASDIVKAHDQIVADFGRIDVLVNNAGTSRTMAFETISDETWQEDLDLKLFAAIRFSRLVWGGMKQRKWGRIINIASTHGLVASEDKVAYVSAKHGIVGMTKVVAIETANHGVTCNAICPGWVLTPLVQKQIEDRAKAEGITVEKANFDLLAEKQPQRQFTKPEQIGGLAVFLASDTASNMQGTQLVSDGGWVAQ
jgi:3-hydroxybutyrate dehydrogenase